MLRAGALVRIRDDLNFHTCYGNMWVTHEMIALVGQIARIKHADSTSYAICKSDQPYWTDAMFSEILDTGGI